MLASYYLVFDRDAQDVRELERHPIRARSVIARR
jgi:hypothetical protein